MAGGQLAPPHVLSQYEWSAAFPVSTKAIRTITMGNRSMRVIVAEFSVQLRCHSRR